VSFSGSFSSSVSLRMARNDDDEEEAARERRRRARQERMKSREGEEHSGQPDSLVMTISHR